MNWEMGPFPDMLDSLNEPAERPELVNKFAVFHAFSHGSSRGGIKEKLR
jgi:hypothetical protein